MENSSLNANFLSPEQLLAFGVIGAAERNILVHNTAVILDFGRISFGRHVRIDPYVVITCKDVCLGDYVHIGGGCTLSGAGRIELGDFSGLSNQCLIYSSSDDYSGSALTNPTVPSGFSNVQTEDVILEKHVILGAQTIVLPGAILEEGASVGARSLVKGTLAPWTIYTGTPAKALRPRLKECLTLENKLRSTYSDKK